MNRIIIENIKKLIKNITPLNLSFTIIIIVISLTLLPDIYHNAEIAISISSMFSVISGIATSIICIYTILTLNSVNKSNNENKKNDLIKDKKNTFENKFALLLQQHNNYLDEIKNESNILYDSEYILKTTGLDALSIIRGNTFNYRGKFNYFLFDDELLIKLDDCFFNDYNLKLEYFELHNLVENNYDHEYYMSETSIIYSSCIYTLHSHYPNLAPVPIEFYCEGRGISDNYINLFKEADKIKSIILKNNTMARNTLSPYMRIVYHILKLVNENTKTKKEMKGYTNIIRSIIPYNILALIAVNSMFFYKKNNTPEGLLRNIDILKNDQSNKYITNEIINDNIVDDYHKFYLLLKKSDFFEHLTMDFTRIINRFDINKFNITDNIDIYIDSAKPPCILNSFDEFLIYEESTLNSISLIYSTIIKSLYSISTDHMIFLFYFNSNIRYKYNISNLFLTAIKNKGICFNHTNMAPNKYCYKHIPIKKLEMTIKTKIINLNTTFFINENKIQLSKDFVFELINGKIIKIAKTDSGI